MPDSPPWLDRFCTERLVAERLTEAHYPDLLRMHADPVQMALLGGVRNEAQTRTYLDANLAHWAAYGFGVWILRERGRETAAIGRALVRHFAVDGADEVELGYSLSPAYWGRGLATEIAAECVRVALDTLGLPSVVGITLPHNARSRRVLEKIGMCFEKNVIHAAEIHVLYRRRAADGAS